jgi:hypothetical protein
MFRLILYVSEGAATVCVGLGTVVIVGVKTLGKTERYEKELVRFRCYINGNMIDKVPITHCTVATQHMDASG